MPPGWQRLMRLPFETTGTNVMYPRDDGCRRHVLSLRRHFDCAGRVAGLSMPPQSKKRRGSEVRLPTRTKGGKNVSQAWSTDFHATRRRHRNGGGAADAGNCRGQAGQDRPPHGEDRAARAGRHPDGAGHQPVPQAPWPEARRPQGGAGDRRYRRQPGRHQDQGAGADRTRPRGFHRRPARRLRAPGDLRLRRPAQDARS